MSYAEFLSTKRRGVVDSGHVVAPDDIHPSLYEWQREIVVWASRKGRAAIFADCGLGKSFMQIEWARLGSKRALIFAPLSVARQTVREALKLDFEIKYVRDQSAVVSDGVWITNYEMLDRFDPASFDAVVLDESSILKNVDGKTRQRLTKSLRSIPHRLACTATPAPNDVVELCNHAEFLGAMSRREMLASFFVHDEIGWRPKGHAVDPMLRWMATWCVALRRPSDAGWSDTGYDLPPLTITPDVVDVDIDVDGQLFAVDLGGVGGRSKVRRQTLSARCDIAVDLAGRPGQWIVWCGLNDEASRVASDVEGAVDVKGSWTPEAKAEALEAFQDGQIRVLVTKPTIAGFGMNFQNCHQMVFVGLSDSYEAYYQAIRRCWRFGQVNPVEVHIVVSRLEYPIVTNVIDKESEAAHIADALIRYSPIHKEPISDRAAAVPHRRRPRRMLASTTRR